MSLYLNLLLFAVTLIGGSVPLWFKGINQKNTNNLLAFSGSFLLSITLLHLLPETFMDMGSRAGLFILIGFFLQLILQRLTHGVEHGHAHLEEQGDHAHHFSLIAVMVGLSVHAFMEGLPLGYYYREEATTPSLYMAVAAHKIPEAILLCSIVCHVKTKRAALITVLFFSSITPLAAWLAELLGMKYLAIAKILVGLIPIVAGAFIHIATTIFFESGTRQHLLTWQKIFSIISGVGIALSTLLIE